MNLLRFQNAAGRFTVARFRQFPGPCQVAALGRWLGSCRRSLLIAAGMVLLLELAGSLLALRSPLAEPLQPGDVRRLERDIVTLQKKLAAQAPEELFIVIDTAHNQVSLRRQGRLLVTMLASCGSGNVLEDPAGGRTWVFETPRGIFSVQSKVANPLWIKPDWAYLEAGEEIPKNPRERAVPGMLGDYALGIGHGYFIHGTLYKRMLGRNVSHGCIRLGDADLKLLVKSVPIGTRVMIY